MKKTVYRTYTQEEISAALYKLNKSLEDRLQERKDLNQSIRKIRENIEFYETIDQRQFKISWD